MASNVKVNDWYFATLPTQAQNYLFKNFPVLGCHLVYNFVISEFLNNLYAYMKNLSNISHKLIEKLSWVV